MKKRKVLNVTEIEDQTQKLIKNKKNNEFIANFLSLFDIPKTSIARAKSHFDEGKPFKIKNKVHYEEVDNRDVVIAIDTIEQDIKNYKSIPRYIIVNNFTDIAAIDTKMETTLNIPFDELPTNIEFFLAWNGIEKADYQEESPADRKAAERFAKLYDVIVKDNPDAEEHTFNIFLIRVLFLLFAEDTGIMQKGIFTNTLKTRTSEDGHNFNDVIKELFEILDISSFNRGEKARWLLQFPYVNGKLFGEEHVNLNFSKVSRQLLIEAGELLNWNEINPDILGSMIQSVASAEDRHISGMHYTSVPNINKVIKPLFLDELNDHFNNLNVWFEENRNKDITEKTRKINNKEIAKSLSTLLERISNMKFLDPACGSGNFLIITYKEIRRLEIKILLLLDKVQESDTMPLSSIHLSNFSGIEIDDFAHEVAKLSLWIAEHQMNEEMEKALPGYISSLLPLKDSGNIVQGNALRIGWDTVVPANKNDEIYVMGNPPYIGAKRQSSEQKLDLKYALDENKKYKKIDYIAAWFYLGSKYISQLNDCKLAFVTTNSISQGEQVSMIWPSILKIVQIHFAYTSFKWANSAKNNAGVTVSIIGLSSKQKQLQKFIFNGETKKFVENITPYLVEGKDIIVANRKNSISGFPKAFLGSLPLDGGHLILDENQYRDIINKYPEVSKITKKYVGSMELINENIRYVIWMNEEEYKVFKEIPFINQRVNAVRKFRENGGQSAKGAISTPYEFFTKAQRENSIKNHHKVHLSEMMTIVVPRVSSENRLYVPMGFVGEDTVVSDSAIAIYSAPTWLLALLESRMHMVWLGSIGGKLKTDFRYSVGLVYNTFPIQNLSTQRKNEMKRVMLEILDLREYEGGNLATLYNKNTMPETLKKKHDELDRIIERAYRQKPFESDEERLTTLLNLYKTMTEVNKNE